MWGIFVLLCIVTVHNCLAKQLTEVEAGQVVEPVAAVEERKPSAILENKRKAVEAAEIRRFHPHLFASMFGKRAISDAAEHQQKIGKARARRDSELRRARHARGGERDISAVLGNELEAAEPRKRRSETSTIRGCKT